MGLNLLITGGLGYIGSFTAKNYLKNTKKKPFVIDNLSRGNKFAKKYSKSKILDISNKDIKNIIEKEEIEVIFHLASLTCVRESIKNKNLYLRNYKSQIKFIKNLKKTNVRYYIFSSSLSIFEKNKFKKNLSPYSKFKLKIEKYLKKISSKNFKVIVLRYPNVIGSDTKGLLGEKNNFINRIIPIFYKNIINKKKNILYYDYKNKIYPCRNYMHVEDVAEINVRIIKNLVKFKKKFQLFNLLSKKEYTNFQVMLNLSKLLNIKPKFNLKKIDEKESVNQFYKSKDEILKIIKYKLKYTNLRKILKTNIKWFKKIY